MKMQRIMHVPFLLFVVVSLCMRTEAFGQINTAGNSPRSQSPGVKGPDIDIVVTYVSDEIAIDGKLDEQAWSQAQPYVAHFFQHEPLDRVPSREKTKLIVVQDDDTIYFGIQAFYENPDQVVAAGMRRDIDTMRGDLSLIHI